MIRVKAGAAGLSDAEAIFAAQTAPVVYLNGTLLFVAGVAWGRVGSRPVGAGSGRDFPTLAARAACPSPQGREGRCNLCRRVAFWRLEARDMTAITNVARAARLLSLVLFDIVRPSRPEYRLPARWLG